MTPLARTSDPLPRLTPQRRRAIAQTLLVPVTIAMLTIAGPLAPSMSAAEEVAPNAAAAEGDAAAGSQSAGPRSAGTAWRFTKDGPKEIVVTPEQKARQAARKARRAQRHAAEKAAAAAAKAASDAGKPAVAAPVAMPPAAAVPTEKIKEASKDAPPSGKAGSNVNGAGGAK